MSNLNLRNLGLKLVKFDISQEEFLPSLIECYKDAFAWNPWYEWKKCNNCGMKFGKELADELKSLLCLKCGSSLDDFWSYDQVQGDIGKELSHERNTCYILIEEQTKNVVGFSWAYVLQGEELEEHLELEGVNDVLVNCFPGAHEYVYQDELGIIREYQGKKLAKELFRARLADYEKWGIKVGVVRTKTLPPSVTYLWYQKLGYSVVQEYNDSDGRVVMAIKFSDLKNI